jgi:wyosine [tRNA(Phe)-imidazoG37] synthetase (radical SAM superfamily)
MGTSDANSKKQYKYLFGPVPSRRLGRSLGVDLVPLKTCTLDCIFCQLGHTVRTVSKRKEYVPTEDVCSEVERWCEQDGNADAITLSGSGEPTLHSRFGDVLACIDQASDVRKVLLTNGTLLHLPDVRQAAQKADVVKVTLSAWDEQSFQQIHRPATDITFAKLIEGERMLRDELSGELWIEVFVLGGINSTQEDMTRIAGIVNELKADHVHLNTVVRPPAESYAKPVEQDKLEGLQDLFEPTAEIIAEFDRKKEVPFQVNETEILSMLERRPCTLRDLADVFGLHVNEVAKYTGDLLHRERIQQEQRDGTTFFYVR